jgi:photosystem II stability/assembly factor-like uncharacterized protein
MATLAHKTLLLGIAAAGDHLVAVGDRGIVVTSADGSNWTQVATPVQATLTAISFADANNGWAVGHDSAVLHTADGGKTWTQQNYAPVDHKPLLAVLALDAQHALATGAYGLFLQTSDGGAHWSDVPAPALLEDGRHLNAIIKLKDGTLFIAGETGLLGVSSDGKDWKRLKLPYEGSLFGALPHGDHGALVFGLRGNAFVSDDVRSGKWTRIDTQTTQSMFGGAVLPDGRVALAGADGEILLIGTDGKVSKARGPKDTRSLGSGTLSAVMAWKGGVLVAGETGVSQPALK